MSVRSLKVAVCALLLWLGAGRVAGAQQGAPGTLGTVSGMVLDGSSGDPIIEAGVEAVGQGKTTRTDLDGRFTLKLPPGTYQLRFFAPLYQGARLERVVVEAGKVATADATLRPAGQAGVEVVEVVAQADKAAEETQLLRRKKAAVVSDNIAAETIKKSPDSDAAEVVQRIPAVTVKDDKFIFVRGLNERYSSALLEGSRLPSTDPDRRIVPLDLFPADFLESVSIVKTYTPDLPGDFAGGLADIRLREFPEKLSYSIGTSVGGNTEATFQDFDTYKGGGFDYFGFDQNVRSLPALIPDKNIRGATPAQAQAYGRAFKDIWDIDTVTAPPNFGVNFSIGNTLGPFGFTLASVYSTEYKVRREQIERQFLNAGTADDPNIRLQDDFRFDFSTFEVKLGGVFTSAYEISPDHRLTFRSLFNRLTTDDVANGNGSSENISDAALASSSLTYVQEELAFGQFGGEHRWPGVNLDWRTAFARTTQEIPDNRFVFRVNDAFESTGSGGSRVFGDLTEYLTDSAFDVTIPFSTGLPFTDFWSGLPAKVKFGPAYSVRDRNSTLRVFKFNRNGTVDQKLPTEEILSPENIRPVDGYTLVEDTLPQNAFKGNEEIAAGYGMLDLPLVRNRLRLIAGARAEYSYITLDTFDPLVNKQRTIIKNNTDPLPGVNLVYSPRDDMNVRLGYSQSVSRPDFRELSPAIYPAARGLRGIAGNPNLVQAEIESFDLRWEWFFSPSELVSLSGFYKNIDLPIEAIVITQGGTTQDSFANSEKATLEGFEFEGRKNLGFVSPALETLTFHSNVTYVHSNVTAGDPAFPGQATTSSNRPLQGQADYVVNSAVEYSHDRWGTARLLYNTIGPRLSSLGVSGLPDIEEERRDQLDFVYLVKVAPFGTPLNFKFAAENLLDDDYEFTQGGELQRKYHTGVKLTFGISYSY